MAIKTLLIANRGEIAIRIRRAAVELGLATVAVFSEDDAGAPHVANADAAHPLPGFGPAAYLDIEALIAAAREHGADAIHPGYGFASENPKLAERCEAAGITFVGPTPATLAAFGDKTRARSLAERCGVPVPRGTGVLASADDARRFLASLGEGRAIVLKAVAGGGGRGMRVVECAEEVGDAFARSASEAAQAFGDGSLFAEERLVRPRHVEVQVLGDGTGAVIQLGERECSLQRRHQKLVEIAPSPSLSTDLRARLFADALRMAVAERFRSAGTFEFLVTGDMAAGKARYAFIEANPRLQVEHTVTEEVTGLDLVRLQLEIASGKTLRKLGLDGHSVHAPRGYAIQIRVNAETIDASGQIRPGGGRIAAVSFPGGPGVRVDSAAAAGTETNPRFDSLLAKVVVHSSSRAFADAAIRAQRALDELEIAGIRSNVAFLRNLVRHPDFVANRVHTQFLDEHVAELAAVPEAEAKPGSSAALAGARVDAVDPLAVLSYGKGGTAAAGPPTALSSAAAFDAPAGTTPALALMQGTILSVDVARGDAVSAGQPLMIMSAMKMEHVIEAPASGTVLELPVAAGDTVPEGQLLALIEDGEGDAASGAVSAAVDLDAIRSDLAESVERHAFGLDAARPEAVARRRATSQRTARENVEDLCDPGSFVEYGPMMIAAQRQRRTLDDLVRRTPADGLVAGIGRVNGRLFEDARASCIVMSYDYTVLAGTQGFNNHRKKDRMFELAERLRLPVVFFTEGGGGRPGDTDAPNVAQLDCMAFNLFGKLSGLVPLVAINSGRCFAGNAAILGCCDVVIAARNSNIGMGGPAMIEGGGLGVFRPEEVGPIDIQGPNGVVDVEVEDEAEGVQVAKRYLSYFQGTTPAFEARDQRVLRTVIPENRLRVYDVRTVVDTIADEGSVLELRRRFGLGMITALARIEGRPVGIIANNPKHLSGAIDAPAADKAARFMQLCDAFDLPIVFLCDTPGIMVGPEVEKTALVRHVSRMFVVGANLTVPFFTIILRKSYGLGAQAMGGGSHKTPVFTVAWPTGEFGGMGLEGAVKLGFRKELEAIEDPEERRRAFEERVARAYAHGKALNTATHFEIDDVIDPADSRHWLASLLAAIPPPPPRTGKKRPCVDTW